MTWCEESFSDFNEKLRLDETRRGRIDSALDRFAEFVRSDEQLSTASAGEPFLQGSVSTNTAIRPLQGDEYDVDVIYPFKLLAFPPTPSPAQIFNWFINRLQLSDFYKTRLTRKNRCVRINYSGDFHVDIIPSTTEVIDHQPYAVPARDLKDWITNDPIGFANWVQKNDRASDLIDVSGDGVFVRCVRMMKRWRDHKFSEGALSSILLVTMLGNHEASKKTYTPPLKDSLFPEYKTDAAYLYDMLRLTHDCLTSPSPKAFQNPVIPTEDLARGWDKDHLPEFLSVLAKTITALRSAIYSQDADQSLKFYKEALGDSFPTS